MSDDQAQGAQSPAQGGEDSMVSQLKAEAAQRRIENKELKEKLDTLMSERKQVEERTAAEQGKFKELYESTTAELQTLQSQLEEANTKVKTYQEIEEERFKGLLEKVPESLRGQLSEDIPLSRRISLAEALAKQTTPPPAARLPGEQTAATYQEELKGAKTQQEIQAILKKHGMA